MLKLLFQTTRICPVVPINWNQPQITTFCANFLFMISVCFRLPGGLPSSSSSVFRFLLGDEETPGSPGVKVTEKVKVTPEAKVTSAQGHSVDEKGDSSSGKATHLSSPHASPFPSHVQNCRLPVVAIGLLGC